MPETPPNAAESPESPQDAAQPPAALTVDALLAACSVREPVRVPVPEIGAVAHIQAPTIPQRDRLVLLAERAQGGALRDDECFTVELLRVCLRDERGAPLLTPEQARTLLYRRASPVISRLYRACMAVAGFSEEGESAAEKP